LTFLRIFRRRFEAGWEERVDLHNATFLAVGNLRPRTVVGVRQQMEKVVGLKAPGLFVRIGERISELEGGGG
jgi:hypothetical protein